MLQQLFHILLLSIVCIIWGIPVLLIFYSSIRKDNFWYHSFAGLLCFLFFCGCIFISIISAWLYLFVPLKFIYLILLTIALLLFLLLFQREKITGLFSETSWTHITPSFLPVLFVVVSVFLFILLSALQPVNGDTQIYHLQIIQWQNRYKVVPGIANLYPRFGLGSNWFNLISIFYWPTFKNENFTYLNAGFVSWFFIWLFSKWHFYFQKRDTVNFQLLSAFYFFLLIYCMFDWQLYRDAANSTNYDFAVNAFTIVICSFFIEGVAVDKSRNEFSFIALLFALCAISFKLSGIFLLLFIFYHVLISWKTVKWIFAIAAGVLVLLPVLIKNYIITGYPLFPSPLSINSPDWVLPKQLASGLYRYIILSNRFYNYQWSFADKFNTTSLNWIPYWINGILWKHKIILALAIFSTFFLLKKPDLPLNHKNLGSIIIVLLLMMAGWFFTAPDPGRFGYGILLCAAFLTVSLFVYPLLTTKIYQLVLLVTIIVTGIYAIKKGKPIFRNPDYAIHPDSFKEPPYQVIRLNNIDLKLPDKINGNWDRRCYFLAVPCITQKNPYLQARGGDLKDGFRMYPEPDSNFIVDYVY
jgi:hypothetical protein